MAENVHAGSAIDVLREFDATFSVRLVGGPYDGRLVTGEFGQIIRCLGSDGVEADYRINFPVPLAYYVEGPEPKSGPFHILCSQTRP